MKKKKVISVLIATILVIGMGFTGIKAINGGLIPDDPYWAYEDDARYGNWNYIYGNYYYNSDTITRGLNVNNVQTKNGKEVIHMYINRPVRFITINGNMSSSESEGAGAFILLSELNQRGSTVEITDTEGGRYQVRILNASKTGPTKYVYNWQKVENKTGELKGNYVYYDAYRQSNDCVVRDVMNYFGVNVVYVYNTRNAIRTIKINGSYSYCNVEGAGAFIPLYELTEDVNVIEMEDINKVVYYAVIKNDYDPSYETTTPEPTTTKETTSTTTKTITKTTTDKPTEIVTNNQNTNNKLDKAVITKIAKKKKSAKKIKITVKRIKNAQGYQVSVYKSKKAANKNAKALKTKMFRKNKITFSAKNFKNKKKLYVRVRAFKYNQTVLSFGDWSDVKKVKVK